MPDDPADAADGGPAAAVLAAEIRRLRRAARLSHAELAKRIGSSPVHVALAERGDAALPSADLVHALDRGLDAAGILDALRKQAVMQRRARRASALGALGLDHDAAAPRELAAEIRRLRHAANLSQARLARRIGYSPAYVSLAERETRGLPSANVVEAIDRALGAAGRLVALRRRAEEAHRALRPTPPAAARDRSGPLKLTIEVAPSADGPPGLAGLWRELAHQATQLATALETDSALQATDRCYQRGGFLPDVPAGS